jgi:hypothetical protein
MFQVVIMSKLVLTLEEGSVNLSDLIEKLKIENPDHIMKESEAFSDVWDRSRPDDHSNSLHYFGSVKRQEVIDAVKADIQMYMKISPQNTDPLEYDEAKRQLKLTRKSPYASGATVNGTWFQVENYYNISPEVASQFMSK